MRFARMGVEPALQLVSERERERERKSNTRAESTKWHSGTSKDKSSLDPASWRRRKEAKA